MVGTTIAGIDVHKKVLMVVVAAVVSGAEGKWQLQRQRFGTAASELRRLRLWLLERGVETAVMESTAQYWKPVWHELEPHMHLELAQAYSNRAPRGRKHDFKDAERLVRRLAADELILSFVPPPKQRTWRTITRMKAQLVRERVRLHNQVECLLEEMSIKLSSVISDLLGASGVRILRALANGETDPARLAALGSLLLKCTQEQLIDALTGNPQPMQRRMLALYLERLQMLEEQIASLQQMAAEAMQGHQEAVVRLAEVPGFGADSAQQVIAEVGPQAATFAAACNLTSWVGTCPGRQESAEQNQSPRSAKGNKPMRRLLTEAAHAAVRTKGSHFQEVFRRLLPRLGVKRALWAIAHRLCRLVWKILHDGVHYVELGTNRDPVANKQRTQSLTRALRRLGYEVTLKPIAPAIATA